jgi:hypothetical protein
VKAIFKFYIFRDFIFADMILYSKQKFKSKNGYNSSWGWEGEGVEVLEELR